MEFRRNQEKMEERFDGKSVPCLKDFLTKRGIQVSDQGRSKRKAEVVALAVKAREMKLQRIDEDDEDTSDVITSKLNELKRAQYLARKIFRAGATIFLRYLHLLSLICIRTWLTLHGEYTPENLKSFKSSAWIQVIFRWSCSRLHDVLCEGLELYCIQV